MKRRHRRTRSHLRPSLSLEALEPRKMMTATPQFDWQMADRFGTDRDQDGQIDMHLDHEFVASNAFRVDLDASGSTADSEIVSFRWQVSGPGLDVVEDASGLVDEYAAIFPHDDPDSYHSPFANLEGARTSVILPRGHFSVELTIITAAGETARRSSDLEVRDLLIVSLGDSIASGEGNPEFQRGEPIPGVEESPEELHFPKWADTEFGVESRLDLTDGRLAHRTPFSYAAQEALRLERSDPHSSVTFVSLGWSGAGISSIVGSSAGTVDKTAAATVDFEDFSVDFHSASGGSAPQLDRLAEVVYGCVADGDDPADCLATKSAERPVDAMMVSAGANDIGFSTIVKNLALLNSVVQDVAPEAIQYSGQQINTLDELQDAVDSRLDTLNDVDGGSGGMFGTLKAELDKLTVRRVFLAEYHDPTTDESGEVPNLSLTDLVPIPFTNINADREEGEWARESVVQRLNQEVSRAVELYREYGWVLVDGVDEAFSQHGYAVNDPAERWVVTAAESVEKQGPAYTLLDRVGATFTGIGVGAVAGCALGGIAGSTVGLGGTISGCLNAAAVGAVVGPFIAGDIQNTLERAATTGTLHPNEQGHAQMANLVAQRVGDAADLRDPFLLQSVPVANLAAPSTRPAWRIAPAGAVGLGRDLQLRNAPDGSGRYEFMVDGVVFESWQLDEIGSLTIDAAVGNLQVHDLPSSIHLSVSNADELLVGSNGDLSSIEGELTISRLPGERHATRVVVDGAAATSRFSVKLTEQSLVGLAPGEIHFQPQAFGRLEFTTGSGSDDIEIPTVPNGADVVVHTGPGRDEVLVGIAPTNLDRLSLPRETASQVATADHALSIFTESGADEIEINSLFYDIPEVQSLPRIDPIIQPRPIVGTVTVGAGGGMIAGSQLVGQEPISQSSQEQAEPAPPSRIGVPIFVHGGRANDTVRLSPATGMLGTIMASVTVDGGSHTDQVRLHDANTPTGQTYSLFANGVTREGFAGLRHEAVEGVTLEGARSDSEYQLEGNHPQVNLTLVAGEGDDAVTVAAGSRRLDAIQGRLSVAGNGGRDSLTLVDSSSFGGRSYTIATSSLQPTRAALVTHTDLEAVAVRAGRGDDLFLVSGNSAATSLYLNGSSGDDHTDVGTGTLDAIAGNVIVVGGLGRDELTINDVANSVASGYEVTADWLRRSGTGRVSYRSTEVRSVLSGDGSDTITVSSSASGTTRLDAGGGNDTVQIRSHVFGGSVYVDGQSGSDALDYSNHTKPMKVNLATSSATALAGITSIENVTGGAGSDLLVGDSGANKLSGRGGRDVLIGGRGADALDGGADDDLLVGDSTSFDRDHNALDAIMRAWTGSTRYERSVAAVASQIQTAGHALTDDAINDDGARDRLTGGGGRDYFRTSQGSRKRYPISGVGLFDEFWADLGRGAVRDVITDQARNEIVH